MQLSFIKITKAVFQQGPRIQLSLRPPLNPEVNSILLHLHSCT